MLHVFAADSSDIDWMIDLYLDGVEHGHFLLDMSDKDYLETCRRNISSIVFQKQIIDFQIQAYAMIFEEKGRKIGFAVMSEIHAGTGGNELHLFAVDQQVRNRGYGQLMLEEIIKRVHPLADMFVRCFPASKHMKSLLRKNGFHYSHVNHEGAEVYLLKKAAQAAFSGT